MTRKGLIHCKTKQPTNLSLLSFFFFLYYWYLSPPFIVMSHFPMVCHFLAVGDSFSPFLTWCFIHFLGISLISLPFISSEHFSLMLSHFTPVAHSPLWCLISNSLLVSDFLIYWHITSPSMLIYGIPLPYSYWCLIFPSSWYIISITLFHNCSVSFIPQNFIFLPSLYWCYLLALNV